LKKELERFWKQIILSEVIMNKHNACIVSFYMDNVSDKTVQFQREVVQKFNKSKIPHYTIKVDTPHGISIDYFWGINGCKPETLKNYDIQKQIDHDVALILDIDCIPLSDYAIDFYVEKAAEGRLIGNAQRSNHINNNQHVFAAPSAMGISKSTFQKIGIPSALETSRSDVGEEYTWKAEEQGIPVDLLMPLRYDKPPIRFQWEVNQPPYWALADGMPVYGIGTTFGNEEHGELFWHSFQIFHPGQQENFWNKCQSILV